eukprot:4621016-Prymnesium_polylepis.3
MHLLLPALGCAVPSGQGTHVPPSEPDSNPARHPHAPPESSTRSAGQVTSISNTPRPNGAPASVKRRSSDGREGKGQASNPEFDGTAAHRPG